MLGNFQANSLFKVVWAAIFGSHNPFFSSNPFLFEITFSLARSIINGVVDSECNIDPIIISNGINYENVGHSTVPIYFFGGYSTC